MDIFHEQIKYQWCNVWHDIYNGSPDRGFFNDRASCVTSQFPGSYYSDIIPRTDGGANIPPRFFVDCGETEAHGATKYNMAIPASFLHIMCKLWPPTVEGQVTRSIWMTRPHITCFQLWDQVRARVDDRALWKLQDVCNVPIGTYNLYISFLILMT